LIAGYYKTLDENDRLSRQKNAGRLQRAGFLPEVVSSYFKFKNPFAVYSIDKSRHEGKITIPDVDLPYLDTVRINGALVSIIGWLRGRGFMAGPGAARILYEKYSQIKEGNFDPESDFGSYMQQFSILRMYQPELMDRLIEEKMLGGTGDI